MLLCSRLLSFSKTCLKEMWRRLGKERGWEDPEDIIPVHGWQRREGGCMDITPHWWRSSESKTHSPSSTTSGWSLPCLTSSWDWCREWGQGLRSKSGRSDCIWAAFERLTKISDSIRSAFQLNSFNIGIDSSNNQDAFDVHFGSFEMLSGHSDRIQSGLPCRFSLEWDQNVRTLL